ncbi:MAG: hypothetical protein AAF282_04725 [Cyanobacteria bacterium P01_A01_bin.15]
MPHLSDTRLIALHSQHSIQSHDLLTICNLAKAEDSVETIESSNFDQFLGFAVHLFVTTQSQHTREQLSQKLPTFGSAAVLPLLKILWHGSSPSDLKALARQSLENMTLYSLIIGLGRVLDLEVDAGLRAIAIQMLRKIIQENDQYILLLLPKLVSQKTWQLLKAQLLDESPYPVFNTRLVEDRYFVQVRVVNERDERSRFLAQADYSEGISTVSSTRS